MTPLVEGTSGAGWPPDSTWRKEARNVRSRRTRAEYGQAAARPGVGALPSSPPNVHVGRDLPFSSYYLCLIIIYVHEYCRDFESSALILTLPSPKHVFDVLQYVLNDEIVARFLPYVGDMDLETMYCDATLTHT